MAQYKVFTHPCGDKEAVKQGWSWPAFFFSYLWALCKKQYALGAGVFVVLFTLGFVLQAMNMWDQAALFVNLICLGVNVFFGLRGNQLRERNLLRRGYEEAGFIGADNADKAVSLFLKTARV